MTSRDNDRAVTDARDIVLRLLREGRSAKTACIEALALADRYLQMYPDDVAVRNARDRHLNDLRWPRPVGTP